MQAVRVNARLITILLVSDFFLIRDRRKCVMAVVMFIICNALTVLSRMIFALACYRKKFRFSDFIQKYCRCNKKICNTHAAVLLALRRPVNTRKLTLRLLISYIYIYIYGTPILDVSRSHTTTQHSR